MARNRGRAVGVVLFAIGGLCASAAVAQPILTEGFKLVADERLPLAHFGNDVAVDGDFLAIAASEDDRIASGAGAVYTFHRQGAGWDLEQVLTAPDGMGGDGFGGSVALSGSTLAVGAPGADPGPPPVTNEGAVYVFDRTGEAWMFTAKLIPEFPGRTFGVDLALSGDELLVGSGDNEAVLFERDGNDWNEVEAFSGAGFPDFFGARVALDGDLAVIGATRLGAGPPTDGAWVFERTGDVWGPGSELTPDDPSGVVVFGGALAVSGETILVGAPGGDDGGSAFVFDRTSPSAGWSETQRLKAPDPQLGDFFGSSVAIDDDRVVAGAMFDDHGDVFGSGANAGSAHVFERDGGTWRPTATLLASDAEAQDIFGAAVAASGGVIAVGAENEGSDADLGLREGAAYVYQDLLPCTPTATAMCLNGGRFRVEVAYRDFNQNRGSGQVVPFGSNDSGLYFFFDPDNWEMLVKVLNGCGINGKFWVFMAATTNVEYTLTVTDTQSGLAKAYTNPLGSSAVAITDTEAFAVCDGAPTPRWTSSVDLGAATSSGMVSVASEQAASPTAEGGLCVADADTLCLNQGRFRVEVAWRNFVDETGDAMVVPFGSDDSGLLWFFDPDNWEMLIKVLDGCNITGNYWIFFAATTNVEFAVTVTDTETGQSMQYQNSLGAAADAVIDTAALAVCP